MVKIHAGAPEVSARLRRPRRQLQGRRGRFTMEYLAGQNTSKERYIDMSDQHRAPQDLTELHQRLIEKYRRLTPENRGRLMAYLETIAAGPDIPPAFPDSAR